MCIAGNCAGDCAWIFWGCVGVVLVVEEGVYFAVSV